MIPMISPECKARQICKFHHWHLLRHSSALGFLVTKNLPFIPMLHKTNKLQNLAVYTCFFLNPVSKGVWENSHAMTALHTAFVKSGSLGSGQHLLFSWAWKHSDFCLFSPISGSDPGSSGLLALSDVSLTLYPGFISFRPLLLEQLELNISNLGFLPLFPLSHTFCIDFNNHSFSLIPFLTKFPEFSFQKSKQLSIYL